MDRDRQTKKGGNASLPRVIKREAGGEAITEFDAKQLEKELDSTATVEPGAEIPPPWETDRASVRHEKREEQARAGSPQITRETGKQEGRQLPNLMHCSWKTNSSPP